MQGIVHIDDSPTSKQAGAWWHTTTSSAALIGHIETVKELIDVYSQEDLNKLDRSCAL